MPAQLLNLANRIGKIGLLCALNKTGAKRLRENQNDESQYVQ